MSNELEVKTVQLDTFGSYEDMRKAYSMAEKLATSTIVPKDYQGNPANCMIAMDMATRLQMGPLMVMQGLYIVHGRPSWSGQFAIAIINGSRRYKSPLKFEMQGRGDTLSCYAYAEDLEGNLIKGTTVTMTMVKAEGWHLDKGTMKSKWNTMPEQMMMYRSASLFARTHCPDLLFGMRVEGEVEDTTEVQPKEKPVNPFAKKEYVAEIKGPEQISIDLSGTPFEGAEE